MKFNGFVDPRTCTKFKYWIYFTIDINGVYYSYTLYRICGFEFTVNHKR